MLFGFVMSVAWPVSNPAERTLDKRQEASIEDDRVSNEIFQFEEADDLHGISASKPMLGRAQACYLVAAALATLGWFWLIAWCALRLV